MSGRVCPCINVSKANSVFILNILPRQSVTFHSAGYKWHKTFVGFFAVYACVVSSILHSRTSLNGENAAAQIKTSCLSEK